MKKTKMKKFDFVISKVESEQVFGCVYHLISEEMLEEVQFEAETDSKAFKKAIEYATNKYGKYGIQVAHA